MLYHLLSSPGPRPQSSSHCSVPSNSPAVIGKYYRKLPFIRTLTARLLEPALARSLKFGSRNRDTLVPHSHTKILGDSFESSISVCVFETSDRASAYRTGHSDMHQCRYASWKEFYILSTLALIYCTSGTKLDTTRTILAAMPLPYQTYSTNDNSPRLASSQGDTAPGGVEAPRPVGSQNIGPVFRTSPRSWKPKLDYTSV